MATLLMTIGDSRSFQVAVTKAGVAQDLAGIASLKFTIQSAGGTVLAQWGLGTGVVVSAPTTAGLAVLTVTPTMLAWATQEQTLKYTWSLVDASGNVTQALDTGVLNLTLPP